MDLGLKYVTSEDGTKRLTIPEDRRAQAIAYVQKGAAGTAQEIEATVQEGHDVLARALDGVSEVQAAYKPSPDDWSILELMAHVVTTQQIVAVLSSNLAAGHLPPGFGPQFEEESAQDGVTVSRFGTLAEARAASDAAHADLLACIRTLDGAVDTDIRFKHFVFGRFNCREWAVFQRIHDGDHTPQIARIKATPGYPASNLTGA
jgi:hypothetical protein